MSSIDAPEPVAVDVGVYSDSVKCLVDHTHEHDHDPFSRRAVEECLATVADTRAPATVSFRYRALQQLCSSG